jgi:penicillin-binding protein 1A
LAKKKSPSKKSKSPKKTKRKNKASWKRRLIKSLLALMAAALLLLFLLFGAVYIGLFGPLPSDEDLSSIEQANASEVYSSDGVLLGKYYIQNRSVISFEEIPQVVIDALIATEDSRFFEHEGIDFYSIPRVVIKTIILGDRSGGGGSTISQQLIKNLFGRHDHGALSMPVNKLKENITALKLEELYTKEEIITLYLNTVSFGENIYGIKAAAQRFFNTPLDEISTTEAATLIGMLKANTSYNPRIHPQASLERRNTVLALMVKQGTLDPEAFNTLKESPINLDYQKLSGQHGSAPYLRAHIVPELERILKQVQNSTGKEYNLYNDGLKIKVSLDSRLQKNAETAVRHKMRNLQRLFDGHWKNQKPWDGRKDFLWDEAKKSVRYQRLASIGKSESEIRKVFETETRLNVYTSEGYVVKNMTPLDSIAYHQLVLQTGFLAMDASNGQVLAYVGGIDFAHFPYDHVQSSRQVGSTFKPFLYATALEAGIAPCDYIENEPIIFSNYDDWQPENAGGEYGGFYSVKGGLAKSVNTVAARLVAETGPEAVASMARKLGIKGKLPDGPSIALGVADLSLLEMVSAYTPFANGGTLVEPRFILKIENAQGETIYKAEDQPQRKEVLSYDVATTVREMLRLVADSGTARSLKTVYGLSTQVGGKTGTTQNNADGWFISITPKMVCGAWVGGQSPITRFRSTRLGQGAATALPIVGKFLKDAESDPSTRSRLGSKFPEADADIQLAMLCPIFIESKTDQFFQRLFDPELREERRELKEQERQERLQEDYEEQEEKKGWMQKLMDKLQGKKKDRK